MISMKKITNLNKYFTQKNKKLTYFLYIVILILFIITLVYKIYKKIKEKTVYIGCLYSQTGVLGRSSYDNYQILLDSFNYAVSKYECDINIIPIYKDLGDDLDNFTKWVEECVKKYNIKYFFGCWRSSERREILPVLQKYNLRLFYPLQYEGVEVSKNVYYFGACPNQQLIPGLKFMFDSYYFYKDVYIIGSEYLQISLELVKSFVKNSKNEYNKTIVYSKLYPLDETDFTEFIQILFNKSPDGAIIINIINGHSYYTFSKQLYEMYYKRFPNIDKSLLTNQDEAMKYFSNPKIKINLKCSERYPSLSTSIGENNISKEYSKYLDGNMYVWNFTNNILTSPIYYLNIGQLYSDKDFTFLTNYYKKQGKPIGDTQYCSFLSALFFVKTLKQIMINDSNIYDTEEYDKFKLISIKSLGGDHVLQSNNHITKIFFILTMVNGKIEVEYQHIKTMLPAPIDILSDTTIIKIYADSGTATISDRVIL